MMHDFLKLFKMEEILYLLYTPLPVIDNHSYFNFEHRRFRARLLSRYFL